MQKEISPKWEQKIIAPTLESESKSLSGSEIKFSTSAYDDEHMPWTIKYKDK